ncbi:MAG: hypothetical protein K2F78_02990 [Muribaculaceae bacterium]|nr:hypothetical protein [Muribaculaceae bacterium]
MKKLIIIAFAAVVIGAVAADYNASFDALVLDKKYDKADSVLRLWESAVPDDPELYPARFNNLLARARSSMLVLNGPSGVGEGDLVFTDSAGSVAGSIGQMSMWNDSLFGLGIAEIDRGIKAYPWRLDFRLGRTAASAMRGDWLEVTGTMRDVLSRSKSGINLWQWSGGKALGDSAAIVVSDAAWDYLSRFYESDARLEKSRALEDFGKAVLDVFPSDKRVLNLLGAYNYEAQNSQKALDYFRMAAQADTTDALPLGNMVYVYTQQGDTANALAICRMVAGNSAYDKATMEEFARMEADILTPVTNMEPYQYFFSWLPTVAEQIVVTHGPMLMSAPSPLNTQLPEMNKLRSPFADEEIAVEAVETDLGTVYVWRFPEPETSPLCLFSAFVPRDGIYHYYTIEKSLDDYWVLGFMENGSHGNYGVVERPTDAAAFADLLCKIILSGAQPSARIGR